MVRWLIDLLKEMDDVPRPRGGKEENLKQLSRDREALGMPARRGPGGEADLRGDAAGVVVRNEQKNCFKRKKMRRETAEAQTLHCPTVTLRFAPFLSHSPRTLRRPVSGREEGNTGAGSSLLVIFQPSL